MRFHHTAIAKTVTSLVVAGALLLGAAGVATATPSAPHAPSAACITALKTLGHEYAKGATLMREASDLLRLRALAVRLHRPAAVAEIDGMLAAIRAQGTALRSQIAAQRLVVKAACAPAPGG